MSLIQRLIYEYPASWRQILESNYKIVINEDTDQYGTTRASLKYNQIESPMHEPIVQECRGMVVNLVTNEVVAHPYHKFWNAGEGLAAPIHWSTARVQEKLDGSLILLYHDADRWHVASSGTPHAGGSYNNDNNQTFADAFWALWEDLGYGRALWQRDVTYMFELCAADNRIVVKYEKSRLVLHGARNRILGSELPRAALEEFSTQYRIDLVCEFPLTSLDECLQAAEALDPIKQEGFIVVDGNFNRVKIKSPKYVSLHHIKGSFSDRRVIELWQLGEVEELLTHFPDLRERAEYVIGAFESCVDQALKILSELGDLPRHEFAAQVKALPISGVCFKAYSVKASKGSIDREKIHALFREQTLACLERILERFVVG